MKHEYKILDKCIGVWEKLTEKFLEKLKEVPHEV
jgi:hypothetical protein